MAASHRIVRLIAAVAADYRLILQRLLPDSPGRLACITTLDALRGREPD
jgi:hypothetical protein